VKRLLLLLALLAAPARASDPAPWGAPETVVRHALLVVGRNPHGELSVVRRGDAVVVRTTLVSALLGRGLQSIRRKEQARWPEGAPGHEDSVAYLAALRRGEEAALQEYQARRDGNDDRKKMMAELVRTPTRSFFAVYAIDARREGDAFRVLSARPVVVRDASREYVSGAMLTQVAQGLRLSEDEAARLLAGE
jgi:hypothetical protein